MLGNFERNDVALWENFVEVERFREVSLDDGPIKRHLLDAWRTLRIMGAVSIVEASNRQLKSDDSCSDEMLCDLRGGVEE